MISLPKTLKGIRSQIEEVIAAVWVILAALMPGVLVLFYGGAKAWEPVYYRMGVGEPFPFRLFLPFTPDAVRPWWIAYAIILLLLLVLEGIIYRKNEEVTESSFLVVSISKVIVASALTISVLLLIYREIDVATALSLLP